ncbi:DUF6339 family protein [Ruegeria lacuscaerulensis]|uniref:DUF6339 family protein n=1 Tax=Ruegeria lacuscaerulensis TaxID=55218 RepID=UPI00147C6B23|nr:DUF6339 family protein [Ruegeria lacuscaerulensis]
MPKLVYFSESVLAELKLNARKNLDRYFDTGFQDLAGHNGWSIALDAIEYDPMLPESLDGTPGQGSEIQNSLTVFNLISGMTPAVATEERVWARLTHVECFGYASKRWPLKEQKQISAIGKLISGRQKVAEAAKDIEGFNLRQVNKHYFAKGRTGVRDDNALSRLWWNAYIASRVEPEQPEEALKVILKTADIRQALIERPMLSNRMQLMRGIVRTMRNHPELTASEAVFRRFMVSLNVRGGGVLFEAMDDGSVEEVLKYCFDDAIEGGKSGTQAA